jgi:sec-independent protein translocase protein TatB
MFDISWTEFLLIGVVALIVIGPKELPAVLRTVGQYTRKMRSMASDFQNQFQEAMREAEMADLKKQVDDIATGIKQYDPLKDVRADVEAAGKDIQASLDKPPMMTTAADVSQDVVAAGTGPVVPEAAAESAPELPAPAPEPEPEPEPHENAVAAATGAIAPSSPEDTAEPETTGRAG